MKQSKSQAGFGKLGLALIFCILVLVPLSRVFFKLRLETIQEVIHGPSFLTALKNSALSAGIATLITVLLSYFLATVIVRTALAGKKVFRGFIILPMLIPSVSHGMGLITLLGNNGILTRLFHLGTSIYGLWGVVLGAVMYATPVAFLMFEDVLKYQDCSAYEAADVLGIPKIRQFTGITLPYLRKPLIAIVFSVFTMVATDYGVPLMVGGKFMTIPVVMYQEVIGQLNFDRGAVYGVILLIPAVLAFLLDFFNKERGNSSYTARKREENGFKSSKAMGYTLCILISFLTVLPISAFILTGFTANYPLDLRATLEHITKTMNLGAGTYLLNSILIAVAVSGIGCGISFFTAYFTARMPSKGSRVLHLFAITSAAVPGIVLGLGYVLAFKGSFLQGTLFILILVNLMHFFSSPYLMMYNGLHKLNEHLEAVGATLGISRLRMIRDVFLPQSRGTLTEMATYFFVNSMMTISAVSFLVTAANKPVALMIPQFEAQMQIEAAAIVSLIILLVNLLMRKLLQVARNKLV